MISSSTVLKGEMGRAGSRELKPEEWKGACLSKGLASQWIGFSHELSPQKKTFLS